MAKMKAAMAAVLVMEKEGITQAFGVPGAAINPLHSIQVAPAVARLPRGPRQEAAPAAEGCHTRMRGPRELQA